MAWRTSLFLLLVAATVAAQYQPVLGGDFSDLEAREDLEAAGVLEGAQRVVRFVQVSDAHIIDDDAPYPMRQEILDDYITCLLYTSTSPRDQRGSRMPSSA